MPLSVYSEGFLAFFQRVDNILPQEQWFQDDGGTPISVDPALKIPDSIYSIFIVEEPIFFIQLSVCPVSEFLSDFFPHICFIIKSYFYMFWGIRETVTLDIGCNVQKAGVYRFCGDVFFAVFYFAGSNLIKMMDG